MRLKRSSVFICVIFWSLGTVSVAQAQFILTWHDLSNPARLLALISQPTCPKGFERSRSGTTTYCLIRKIQAPPSAIADCGEIKSGRLGFTFTKTDVAYDCPNGMNAEKKGCYYSELPVHQTGPELKPYCDYLTRGYLGFSYHDRARKNRTESNAQ